MLLVLALAAAATAIKPVPGTDPSKEKELTRLSIFSEKPFSTHGVVLPGNDLMEHLPLSAMRTGRCAVVGKSGKLLSREQGAVIDSYDFVFRMDDAPSRGYEKYVGRKTTLRVADRLTMDFALADTDGLIDAIHPLLFRAGPKIFRDGLTANINDLRIYDYVRALQLGRHIQQMHPQIEASAFYKNERPSIEVVTIYIARLLCGTTDAFEIFESTTESTKCFYYNDDGCVGLDLKPERHYLLTQSTTTKRDADQTGILSFDHLDMVRPRSPEFWRDFAISESAVSAHNDKHKREHSHNHNMRGQPIDHTRGHVHAPPPHHQQSGPGRHPAKPKAGAHPPAHAHIHGSASHPTVHLPTSDNHPKSTLYFFAAPGSTEPQGPVSSHELHRMAAAGKLHPNTLVWSEHMDTWRPIAFTNTFRNDFEA